MDGCGIFLVFRYCINVKISSIVTTLVHTKNFIGYATEKQYFKSIQVCRHLYMPIKMNIYPKYTFLLILVLVVEFYLCPCQWPSSTFRSQRTSLSPHISLRAFSKCRLLDQPGFSRCAWSSVQIHCLMNTMLKTMQMLVSLSLVCVCVWVWSFTHGPKLNPVFDFSYIETINQAYNLCCVNI